MFVEEEFYHIFNRGIEGRIIFNDEYEKIRFIHTAYVVNNFLAIPPRFDVISMEPQEFLTPIEPYLKIVAGCLMDNHFHFMVTPLKKGGISKFMHRIGVSYSNYFNLRYERKGRLFENTFKAKHVDKNNYALYLTQYIHLNPVDLYRSKYGTNAEETFSKIKEYPWSSLPVYLGKKSPFSLLATEDFRKEILGLDESQYEKILEDTYNELYRS